MNLVATLAPFVAAILGIAVVLIVVIGGGALLIVGLKKIGQKLTGE